MVRYHRRYHRLAEAALALVAATAVLALWQQTGGQPALRALETWSLDLRMRIEGSRAPGPEVALVLVDDRSLTALGRWPFSRRLIARATDAIDRMGAKAIVFDLLFLEPEKPVPDDVRKAARTLAARDPSLAPALAPLAEDDPDAELAAAFRRSGKVLVPFALTFDGRVVGDTGLLEQTAFARFTNSPRPPAFPLRPDGVLMPVPEIAAAAAGLGHVTIAYDVDGAPRYDYTTLPFGADFLPSIAVRAVALSHGIPWDQVSVALGGGLDIGPLAVPTDAAMRLLIDYRGPGRTFPTYSFADLIAGRLPAEALRGRIVLVGAAAIGINDTFRTPFGSGPLPGIERMANIIDTLQHGRFIGRPDVLPIAEMVAAVALAGLAAMVVITLPTWSGVVVWLVLLAGWVAAAQVALDHGLWLSVAAPMAALLAAMLASLTWRIAVVDRAERRVRSAFRRYLAPAMVAELAAHPERLRLGGESRMMTVLFCDIRNFTTLSETMGEQDLVRLLNRFFTPMVDVVLAHQGTVDKFIGDCLMAFWNAPLDDPHHAAHACRAALAMVAAAETLKGNVPIKAGPIKVGIGINTGPCCVGNLGSEQRFDYSVVGDAVNVASRMEGLTKTFGVRIIAADGTRAAAPDLPWLALNELQVKGRTAPVRVHTLWTGPDDLLTPLEACHDALLAALNDGLKSEAARLLASARGLAGGRLQTAHAMLEQRLNNTELT
ncbi:MAG: adenylate/guanylate cyclase domain-containing protein [Alphaproteobacteria bacterium]|nr:adenylate/guanylate cyclase domain-containing protein [Alphaproteobacteria bacterium]